MTPRGAFAVFCFVGSAWGLVACSSSDKGSGGGDETGGKTSSGGADESGGASSNGGASGAHGGSGPGSGGASSGGGSGGMVTDGSTTSMDGALPASCTDSAMSGTVCITHIDGRAIDADGKAVSGHTLVSACGPTQCNPGYTGNAGDFAIPVGLHLNPDIYSAQVHVRPDKAAFYYALPKGSKGPIVDLGDLRVLDMPMTGPSLNVSRMGTPAQTVTSGDVTLTVPDGVYVRLDVESNLAGDHGKQFRALTIPSKFVSEFADASLNVKALYALEPFESSFEFPGTTSTQATVQLSFANTAKLAAGSAVEVLGLGSYIYPDWITPAAFEKVATAHVSADGSKIDFDAGQGVPYLTWFAIRAAP